MNNQQKLSKIAGIVFVTTGLVFFILGAVFLFGSSRFPNDPDIKIIGSVFFPMGGAFLLVGLSNVLIVSRRKKKVQRLMREGVRYDAEIVRVYEKPYMRANYRSPFVVECGYTDERGRSYLVKSGDIWPASFMTRESDVKARVWVNPNNPKDYYVEVYSGISGANPNATYDFDYR